MSPRDDLRRPLRWLMTIRAVVATTVLLSSLVIEVIFRPALTLKPFYTLIAATYLLILVYAVASIRLKGGVGFAYTQLVGDILLTTAVVHITGGVESAFSFLYILSILTAATILYRRGAILTAALSWIAYAMLVLLQFYGWLPAFAGSAERLVSASDVRVTYAVFAHLLGFLAVGYLGSALSEKVRVTGQELEERREDLAALQALHRNIIDSIQSAIVTIDEGGRVTFLNRAAEQITGHGLASQVGRPVHALLGEPASFLPDLQAALRGGARLRFEKPFVNARGESLHLGFALSALRDREGTPRGHILVFQDLTEFKAMEEELRLKDRMSVLGRMAAGMAHEIRNPLASMSGSIQILGSELSLSPEQSELMQVVLEESRRLDQLIRDFLQFARPGRFQPEPGDLAQVLRDALVLLRNSPDLREEHRIRTDFDSTEVPYAFDRNQMKQIFWNLAKNALQAMPHGGELRVRLRAGVADEGPQISFADQGVGLSPDQVQRFFEPFETDFPDGTGLGLAIVYRNVQEHQGRVSVRSAPGEGTEFTIHLPRRPVADRVPA